MYYYHQPHVNEFGPLILKRGPWHFSSHEHITGWTNNNSRNRKNYILHITTSVLSQCSFKSPKKGTICTDSNALFAEMHFGLITSFVRPSAYSYNCFLQPLNWFEPTWRAGSLRLGTPLFKVWVASQNSLFPLSYASWFFCPFLVDWILALAFPFLFQKLILLMKMCAVINVGENSELLLTSSPILQNLYTVNEVIRTKLGKMLSNHNLLFDQPNLHFVSCILFSSGR